MKDNLDCTKLNKCLNELDCLTEVAIEHSKRTLTLFFGSPDGGAYEDVTLRMEFEDVGTFHLPFYKHGVFSAHICKKEEAKSIIPDDSFESYFYTMRFTIDESLTTYYVLFDTLRWKLEGMGPIKNEEELIGYDAINHPELVPEMTEALSKIGTTIFDTVMKVVNDSKLGSYNDNMSKTQYNEDNELDRYILKNYSHLMTESERKVIKDIQIEEKVEHSDPNSPLRSKYSELIGSKFKNQGPNSEPYIRLIRRRIIKEYPEEVSINMCPECNKIARTPKAKLCVWCGNSWSK